MSNRLLPAAPPLLFSFLILRLWLAGTLRYYVNERTVWIVLLGGVLFFAVGCVSLYRASRSARAARFSRRGLIVSVVLLGGILAPARPLSAASSQASSLGSLQLTTHLSGGPAGDRFSYWLTNLTGHPDAGWWAGRRATLIGFVAHQSGLPPRSVIVGRYLITCCVVDATLLGFPVQLNGDRLPPQGAWVQVSGSFGRHYWQAPGGIAYPVLEHARVSPVSIPSSPYLSP